MEEEKRKRTAPVVYAIFKDITTPDIREWKELVEKHELFKHHKKFLDTMTATIAGILLRSASYKREFEENGRDVKFYQGAYWVINQVFEYFQNIGLEYEKRIKRQREKESAERS